MGRTRAFCGLFVIMLVYISQSTTILLKNGQSLVGEIVSEDQNFIVLNSNQSKINVLKSMIARIDSTTAADKSSKQTTVANEKKSVPLSGIAPVNCEFVIKLQNGTVFKGPKISEDEKRYVLSVNGSPVNIFKTIIESVDSCQGRNAIQTESSGNPNKSSSVSPMPQQESERTVAVSASTVQQNNKIPDSNSDSSRLNQTEKSQNSEKVPQKAPKTVSVASLARPCRPCSVASAPRS